MERMHHIERSASVPYPPEAMRNLVLDVESYPGFLPWCNGARVLRRASDWFEASLRLAKGPLSHWLTTRNVVEEDRIRMELVDGPFRHLEGEWRFHPLAGGGTEVTLELEFIFSNRVLGKVLAPVFGQIARSMVGAFTARAEELAREGPPVRPPV